MCATHYQKIKINNINYIFIKINNKNNVFLHVICGVLENQVPHQNKTFHTEERFLSAVVYLR